MEVLQKLAFIIMVLDVDLLKLMQFNDLHLLYMFQGLCKTYTDIYEYVNMWMEYYGMLKLQGLISLKLFI